MLAKNEESWYLFVFSAYLKLVKNREGNIPQLTSCHFLSLDCHSRCTVGSRTKHIADSKYFVDVAGVQKHKNVMTVMWCNNNWCKDY